MTWETVIGLEIHARLSTRTKMFCGCANLGGGEPNTRVCPVCLGLPGSLPTVNSSAVELGSRIALALGANIRPTSRFDRKSYFYPDLPRNYQITQYAEPLAEGGGLAVPGGGRKVGIIRIHLEEDAGRLIHLPGSTLVDLNRAGVPLAEIVTRPDLRSGADAAAWFAELRRLLLHLRVCDGNLAAGSLRCDANVSVRRSRDDRLGAPVELKNLNTLAGLRRSLEFEAERQTAILIAGGEVRRETRGWDADKNLSFPMRSKESSPDYRYFPEPDLPPLRIAPAAIRAWRVSLPELPAARESRFVNDLGLRPEIAGLVAETPEMADYFEEVSAVLGDPAAAADWLVGEARRVLNDRGWAVADLPVGPPKTAELLELLRDGRISRSAAKSVFERMAETGRDAAEVVREMGLTRLADPVELAAVAVEVVDEHPENVAAWISGKTGLIDWFVGRMIERTAGRADPVIARRVVGAELDRRR